MPLTPDKVKAWADVAMLILSHGLAGWSSIAGIIKSLNKSVTDAELNEIIRSVQADAEVRRERARRIAEGLDS